MKFILPCEEYEEKAIEFIHEFHQHKSPINGSGNLDGYLEKYTYTQWLSKVQSDLDIANVPEGGRPAFTYFYVREEDDKIVGVINIRLALDDFWRKEVGHIGFCVRPTERNKHYAVEMLRGVLKFCARIGLCPVLLTCNKSNLASAAVLQRCGGRLEAEFYSDSFGYVIQRYVLGEEEGNLRG